MAEYHVGNGFAGVIYAGTLTKDKKRWINKSDVTGEVVAAFWAWMQEQYEEAAEGIELKSGQVLERTISYPDSEYEIVFRKKKVEDTPERGIYEYNGDDQDERY